MPTLDCNRSRCRRLCLEYRRQRHDRLQSHRPLPREVRRRCDHRLGCSCCWSFSWLCYRCGRLQRESVLSVARSLFCSPSLSHRSSSMSALVMPHSSSYLCPLSLSHTLSFYSYTQVVAAIPSLSLLPRPVPTIATILTPLLLLIIMIIIRQ